MSFRQPAEYVESSTGVAIVLDRGAHAVFAIDAARKTSRQVVSIGVEKGRLLLPGSLAMGPDDLFAVADAPNGVDRIQYFSLTGERVGGFYLPDRLANATLKINDLAIDGLGPIQFAGQTFFTHLPGRGYLITEIDTHGATVRQFGALRPTGHESDAAVHELLNLGFALIDPTGGFYFVFQTGVPMFRKYDDNGKLLFERHVEGVEIDTHVQTLPNVWRPRASGDDHIPVTTPLIRTAAVDRTGRLWISLLVPYTYVYDGRGEKVRTIQFQAADTLSPTSMFFASGHRLLVVPGCYEFVVD